MDIVLIPGLWLDGGSWDRVVSVLESAGHRSHPLTLPGMESIESDRSGIGLEDHVAAVVAAIDGCAGEVILVTHSAGAGVAHAAVDARPDRVARSILVGGFPTPDGAIVADGFSTEGPDLPLPPWDEFDTADLKGLDDDALRELRRSAVPSPARLAGDRQRLSDDRRFDVPVTVICTEFGSETLQDWIERGLEPVSELARARHVEFVDLPTGHWPQFTRADDLAAAIVDRAVPPELDEHGRIHPPVDVGETVAALAFLDYQRATLEWKAAGLGRAGLNTTVGASELTLGALLKHMAWVEDHWFSYRLRGRARSAPWNAVDWPANPDWELTSAAGDEPDDLRRLWKTAVGRSRASTAAALAERGFDRLSDRAEADGSRVSLRWIVLHMIEEYARHNGHADLLREAVDGETGE